MNRLIDKLQNGQGLTKPEWIRLIDAQSPKLIATLSEKARAVREREYRKDIYIRGLIEFTSYCKNNCYYCGLRCGNQNASRYRLSPDRILSCCQAGYALGFRTFVLQGGEDPGYPPEQIAAVTAAIKQKFPDCAVTLSCGEQEREVYAFWKTAGADRYLLRHETADNAHYQKLHPKNLSPERRKKCLWTLKELGYQIGAGMMLGSPGQTAETLAEDMLFLTELQPDMIGCGPFIPHHDTPFSDCPAGSLDQTLFFLALLRLTFPRVLLPATTALGTIDPTGQEKGILAGANVVMPNLSPPEVRESYLLYDNKAHTDTEAAEHLSKLKEKMSRIGYCVAVSRGDSRMAQKEKLPE